MANDNSKIPLQPVESSNIAALGYDIDRAILAIQFKAKGSIFHYAPMPPAAVLAFYGAESKGRYYAEHIKGKVAGQKMTGPCPNCGDAEGWLGETCADCGTAVYADNREAVAHGHQSNR